MPLPRLLSPQRADRAGLLGVCRRPGTGMRRQGILWIEPGTGKGSSSYQGSPASSGPTLDRPQGGSNGYRPRDSQACRAVFKLGPGSIWALLWAGPWKAHVPILDLCLQGAQQAPTPDPRQRCHLPACAPGPTCPTWALSPHARSLPLLSILQSSCLTLPKPGSPWETAGLPAAGLAHGGTQEVFA